MNDDLRERLRGALDDHGLPPSPALLERLVEAAQPAPIDHVLRKFVEEVAAYGECCCEYGELGGAVISTCDHCRARKLLISHRGGAAQQEGVASP